MHYYVLENTYKVYKYASWNNKIILACTAIPNMPQKIALGNLYPFTLQKTLEMQHNNNYA